MKSALIISPPLPRQANIFAAEQIKRLQKRLNFVSAPLSRDEVLANPSVLESVEVIFSTWGMPALDEAFLAAAPKLKEIYYCAGSVKGFKSDAAYDRGIRIFSAWGANAIPVTEYTFAQIILSLKHFWARALNREKPICELDHSGLDGCPGAYGSTVGLLSLGQIGRAVARRLQSLEVNIIAFDPFADAKEADGLGIKLVDLETVFAQSDVVSCHTPWLPETEKMLNASHFAKMKPGATFINTARGAVVDEAGMASVLEARKDLTALLDVTYPEPPEEDSPLRTLPNLIRTPHIAGSLFNECQRMTEFMIEEFDRIEKGQSPLWEVTRERANFLA